MDNQSLHDEGSGCCSDLCHSFWSMECLVLNYMALSGDPQNHKRASMWGAAPVSFDIQSATAEIYLTNYFQAKVGKELPKQFPEPLSVGKLDVGNFAFSNAANTLQARNYLKYCQRVSKLVTYYPIICWKNKDPAGDFGGADCIYRLVSGLQGLSEFAETVRLVVKKRSSKMRCDSTLCPENIPSDTKLLWK